MISAVFFFLDSFFAGKLRVNLCTIASSCFFSRLFALLLLSLRTEEKDNARTRGRKAVGLLDVAGDDGREREREKSLAFSRSKIRDAKECEHLHAGFEMRI